MFFVFLVNRNVFSEDILGLIWLLLRFMFGSTKFFTVGLIKNFKSFILSIWYSVFVFLFPFPFLFILCMKQKQAKKSYDINKNWNVYFSFVVESNPLFMFVLVHASCDAWTLLIANKNNLFIKIHLIPPPCNVWN